MERAFGRHDLVGAAAVDLAPLSRELDGRLVGLRSGRAHEDVIEPGHGRQARGERDVRSVAEGRARVPEPLRLLSKHAGDGGRRMAERVDRPSLDEVEVLAPFAVVDERALAADHHEVGRVARRKHVPGVIGHGDLDQGMNVRALARLQRAAEGAIDRVDDDLRLAVDLEVHPVADLLLAEGRQAKGLRDQMHPEGLRCLVPAVDREARAGKGDEALVEDVARELGGDAKGQRQVLGGALDKDDLGGAVDVTGEDVAAVLVALPRRAFDVRERAVGRARRAS